jgi:hypothetical protein
VRRNGDSESNKIAASEALVAYHTARHGQSFSANDCLSTLIYQIYISLIERDNISAT